MTRLLVLGLDQDDALASAITDQLLLAHRAVGSRIELVWPTAFDRISGSEPFDDLVLTSRVATHPDAPLVSNWVAACRTAPSQVPELREPLPTASARECTCGAGLLRMMAGGAR